MKDTLTSQFNKTAVASRNNKHKWMGRRKMRGRSGLKKKDGFRRRRSCEKETDGRRDRLSGQETRQVKAQIDRAASQMNSFGSIHLADYSGETEMMQNVKMLRVY